MPRADQLATVLRTAQQMEREWMRKVPGAGDEMHTPWMPFCIPDFVALMAEALPDLPPGAGRFLEIGAGIGTKMVIARELFGMDVSGVERTDEYASAARTAGLDVQTADALGWDGYGKADLIWFNRPFRDQAAQARLEAQVWAEAAPGTVVICANLETKPPLSWYPVLDAWDDERRGIWQKPFAADG
jgi:trans-aconitate methyltransferase